MDSSKISLDGSFRFEKLFTVLYLLFSPFLKNMQEVEQWNIDLFISLIPGALYFENSAK